MFYGRGAEICQPAAQLSPIYLLPAKRNTGTLNFGEKTVDAVYTHRPGKAGVASHHGIHNNTSSVMARRTRRNALQFSRPRRRLSPRGMVVMPSAKLFNAMLRYNTLLYTPAYY